MLSEEVDALPFKLALPTPKYDEANFLSLPAAFSFLILISRRCQAFRVRAALGYLFRINSIV